MLLAAGSWATLGQSSSVPSSGPGRTVSSTIKLALQGAASCAAAACHNAGERDQGPLAGSEYSVALARTSSGDKLIAKDKHADAFAVLLEERSQRMLRLWKSLPATSVVHPERETLCLRCHVHPTVDQQPIHVANGVPQFRLEDGVSCEACHGPAERWLAAHFRPGWKKLSIQERMALGMNDTRSILGRVQVCVDCHVGRPGAEVDHDLIAAGHPWLHFDAAEYHGRWHKHWDHAKDSAELGTAGFAARLRWMGRLAAAQASLQLLAGRAGNTASVWPDFATYDCSACHHELDAKNARAPTVKKFGAPAMNAWYLKAVVNDGRTAGALVELDRLQDAVTDLSQSMARWQPRRPEVNVKAQHAADLIATWLVRYRRMR